MSILFLMLFIVHFILVLCANAAVFWFLSAEIFVDDFLIEGGVAAYFVLAVIFSFLNAFLLPILKIITFVIEFLTIGLFSLVLNGLLLFLTEESLAFLALDGISFEVNGWIAYLVSGFILVMLNSFLHWVFGGR